MVKTKSNNYSLTITTYKIKEEYRIWFDERRYQGGIKDYLIKLYVRSGT